MQEKPDVILVTTQALLGECLATALPQFRITVLESIADMTMEEQASCSTIILHLDQKNQL